jgi:predicted ABC-type ATPase
VIAGHNGSGKSTLWYQRLADRLQMPLINADRLTLSILPPDPPESLPAWAQRLRDRDENWQRLAQKGVQLFTGLVTDLRMPFAFETVFSHWRRLPSGRIESKADTLLELRRRGYFVVLIFVGLVSPQLSIARVLTRQQQGGHAVPRKKLIERFPRTQRAIAHAAPLADLTLMFDNSRSQDKAFSLVRAQTGSKVLYDCRIADSGSRLTALTSQWLDKVAPLTRSMSEATRWIGEASP